MTIGVLLRNALKMALMISVAKLASRGRVIQAFARKTASGCSAPVVSSPLPMIIRAQMAMRASCPNPVKNVVGARTPPSVS